MRSKRCKNFAWRDQDPVYQDQRANDKLVFKKILREHTRASTKRSARISFIIRSLFQTKFWKARMQGKTAESWRVNYYRWRRNIAQHSLKSVALFKQNNSRPTPVKIGFSGASDNFIGKPYETSPCRTDKRLSEKSKVHFSLSSVTNEKWKMENEKMNKLCVGRRSKVKGVERRRTVEGYHLLKEYRRVKNGELKLISVRWVKNDGRISFDQLIRKTLKFRTQQEIAKNALNEVQFEALVDAAISDK